MKNSLSIIIAVTVLLFAGSAIAKDRVVVIPLNSKTEAAGAPATVGKTGVTRCSYYDGSIWQWDDTCTNAGRPPSQDGELRTGTASPVPRFTNNLNGTVTDNLTGLIWLQNANCVGEKYWSDALDFANALHDGWTGDGTGGDCSLGDGSTAGDWRVPTRFELDSLINLNYHFPALSDTSGGAQWSEGDVFSSVQSLWYWSSTAYVLTPRTAWVVHFSNGVSANHIKDSNTQYVWPVRDN